MISPKRRVGNAPRARAWAGALLLLHAAAASAEKPDHSGHGAHRMTVSPSGMVMHENHSDLPRGCAGISGDYEFTIRASRDFAREVPGMVFGMSRHEVRVPGWTWPGQRTVNAV